MLLEPITLLFLLLSPIKSLSKRHIRHEIKSTVSPLDQYTNKTSFNTPENDIRVPADMWRNPSESESWDPVELEPRYCVNPNERNDTCWKEICVNETQYDLRYYGPGMEYTSKNMKEALNMNGGDIIMIGDSVLTQWYNQLYCYLGASEPVPKMREKVMEHFAGGFRTKIQAFDIPPLSEEYQPQRIIMFTTKAYTIARIKEMFDYFNTQYHRDFNRRQPTFVFNWWLHYGPYEDKGNKKQLENDLKVFALACHGSDAKCIFSESSPQFFDTEAGDGLYAGTPGGSPCFKEPPPSFHTLGTWRNDVLYDVLSKINIETNESTGFVKVMQIFDKLSGIPATAFRGETDCTHFKPNPWIWEPWHMSFTKVLMSSVVASEK